MSKDIRRRLAQFTKLSVLLGLLALAGYLNEYAKETMPPLGRLVLFIVYIYGAYHAANTVANLVLGESNDRTRLR